MVVQESARTVSRVEKKKCIRNRNGTVSDVLNEFVRP